ncbi:MAG: hypothetical protein LWW94_09600 [Candidatus Desulfofervidaceae bacterium]|nr:hypothetical protein [Candidatus Desulfofervidaceae bacterium]
MSRRKVNLDGHLAVIPSSFSGFLSGSYLAVFWPIVTLAYLLLAVFLYLISNGSILCLHY